LNEFIQWLFHLDPAWVYCIIFFFAFVENIFPPSPSDTIIVIGGALSALDKGNFLIALGSATLGSTLGFMTMYGAGKWFGNSIIEKGKLKFVSLESIHKIESWFAKYGYWLIIANRFLSGTRAVISLFAGVSNLDLTKTTALSFVSSLLWNGLLVYAGYALGRHWEEIGLYLAMYSEIVTGIIILLGAIFLIRYFLKRRSGKAS
jgi:membrane protein DedA with SNARE-associated domain